MSLSVVSPANAKPLRRSTRVEAFSSGIVLAKIMSVGSAARATAISAAAVFPAKPFPSNSGWVK